MINFFNQRPLKNNQYYQIKRRKIRSYGLNQGFTLFPIIIHVPFGQLKIVTKAILIFHKKLKISKIHKSFGIWVSPKTSDIFPDFYNFHTRMQSCSLHIGNSNKFFDTCLHNKARNIALDSFFVDTRMQSCSLHIGNSNKFFYTFQQQRTRWNISLDSSSVDTRMSNRCRYNQLEEMLLLLLEEELLQDDKKTLLFGVEAIQSIGSRELPDSLQQQSQNDGKPIGQLLVPHLRPVLQ